MIPSRMGLGGKGKLTTDGQTSEQSSRRKAQVTKESLFSPSLSLKQDLECTRGRVARAAHAHV